MKRWTTILLTLMALTAAMLMVARWVLPLMGIGGVGGELLSPLARLTPIAATVCVCSIVTLVITLRRQPKPAYPQARRLVEEAETWSDDFIIGEELEIAAAFDEQPLAEEPEVEWSFSRPQLTPAIAPIAGNAKIPAPRTHARLGQDLALREHQNESNGISADQAVNLDFVEIFSDMNGLPITTDTFIQQLPPTLPEFAGRAFELAELLAARTNPENKILSVQGLGGVGKTTLALKLAHQLAPQYPNAQIFVDLKGASSQPLSVAEAQAHVIRAYLPAARLPENEAELGKLYNSVLNGKRALLLFDNAANAGQVAPLLPPDGNLVIVTSRQHLSTGALPGMFASRLDSLPAAEAEELLRRLLPQIGDDATRIAELCGHLPLALRLAASALTQNPNLSVDDYARRLSGDQSPDGAKRHVDAVLRASYEMLVPGLRKLWRTLAVFPDTFEVNAAAAVWKIHPARAANALDRLMAYSLIER
ncbi:MAG TPA: NB-ARC domain-containing protein, partial [Blastocatellia bacterium]|nr:NB-ARC domain-containing protein [Blastocatellia bacterium]